MLIPKRPPKAIVRRDSIHVDLGDFSRSRIALKKRWNAGVGFQDTKKHNRCPGNLKSKVVRYVLNCRYVAGLHVDLDSESWDLKQGVVEPLQRLTFLRSREDVVVQVRDQHKLAWRDSLVQIRDDSGFRTTDRCIF